MTRIFSARLRRTFQPDRKKGLAVLLVALILFGLWYLSPLESIRTLASLTDPDKLATLGERGANARLNKIVFYLHDVRAKGVSAESAIGWAQKLNGTKE